MISRGTVDDFNNNDNQSDFVVLEIPRSCVESGYLASTLEKLYALTDTKERIETFRGNVAFSFTGYDNDPRELAEIPEVRTFFLSLTNEWPHWIWFLNRQMGSLRLAIQLLCGSTRVDDDAGRVSYSVNQADLANTLEHLLRRGHALFEVNGIPKKDMQDSLTSAMQDLGMMQG